ncbi:MAG: cob(I)yrinic acid a,c-diamide adenosyltransferase, partial [Pseudomonadota bacterium]|nr:cob(I)yrinic acid a,c-diamide adenosyltransferase [Pseudomonadota bacterium]
LVHTGNGKGKSSAAFGMAIRSIGWGMRVAILQFVKGTWETGERNFFTDHPSDLVSFESMGEGFTWDTQDRDRDIAAARAAWQVSCEMLTSGDYDLVILDELNIVLRYEYLSADEVLAGLTARDPRTTVVVTGRDAPPALLEVADLVTEMTNVKHPFDAGIKAARGFDF